MHWRQEELPALERQRALDRHTISQLVASLFLVVRPGAPSSVLVTSIRHLLLEAMHLFLVAFSFLVVRPGAPSSVLAPSSDALCP